MQKRKKIYFKEFITLQRGFDLPKTDMVDGEIPVIGSTSVIGFHNEFKVNPPGVITGRSGSLGKVQFIKKKYWPHNTSLWTKDFKGNYPKYVYYLLHTIDFNNFNAGAGVPTLNRNHLDRYELTIHELPEQKKIAGMLSNYDDLIENNSRRIQLLDSMAKLIYDEWFVKFKFPGHESSKMIDSGTDFGEIPTGWNVKNLGELGEFKNGINYLRDDAGDKIFSIVNVRNISNSRYISTASLDSINIDYKKAKEYLLKSKDIIIARSACPGEVSILIDEKDNVIYSGFSIRYCLRAPENYLFAFLSLQKLKKSLSNFSTGTALKSVNQETLKNMKILFPDDNSMKSFLKIITPIFNQLSKLLLKNQNLAATRDLLLPKLISGELDVSKLDIKVSEVEA